MRSGRRLLWAALLGVLLVVVAGGSDFVVGSFWVGHAMITALLASLLVLAVTVVVLNEFLAHRDRRRWSVLAQHVLFQLVHSARETWTALVELVAEAEVQIGSSEELLVAAQIALDGERMSSGAVATLADPGRRARLARLSRKLAERSNAVLASWAPVMVGAGGFYAEVFDRHVELQARLDWLADVLAHELDAGSPELTVRKTVATEHARVLDDDWLHAQIVSSAQLAVQLDYRSRALGFELVPFGWWEERITTPLPELTEFAPEEF